MPAKHQLSFGPLPLQEDGSGLPTHAKEVGSTPLVDLCVRAFVRCQQNNQQAAGLLDIKATEFSKAFSVNWPERNSVMKKWDGLPFAIRLEFAKLIAADYELAEPDSQQTRVLRDFAQLLKVVNA